MTKSERVEFNGKIYRRYPNSKNKKCLYFRNSQNIPLHRAVWIHHNGEIPKGFHIHHKDGNCANNALENLECLSPKEHCRAHSELAKKDPTKDIYESRRRWQRSQEGFLHHSKLSILNWSRRLKSISECELCKSPCERYLKFSKKTICENCQKKRQSLRQKERYVPKEKKTLEVVCKICGTKTIQKTKKEKEFCSKNCKVKARRAKGVDDIIRKCVICNRDFSINKYCKTQTCSGLCRGKYITLRMQSGG